MWDGCIDGGSRLKIGLTCPFSCFYVVYVVLLQHSSVAYICVRCGFCTDTAPNVLFILVGLSLYIYNRYSL